MHEYHYNSDFLLTVFLYFPAGQKLQTRTTHSFHCILTVYDPFLVANVKVASFSSSSATPVCGPLFSGVLGSAMLQIATEHSDTVYFRTKYGFFDTQFLS